MPNTIEEHIWCSSDKRLAVTSSVLYFGFNCLSAVCANCHAAQRDWILKFLKIVERQVEKILAVD